MKIAIAGYGLEGRQNLVYWNTPDNEVVVADETEVLESLPAEVPTILGPGAFEKLDDFDMVIRTAGLAPRKIKTRGKIWSATNEFFAKCPAPIIGVTGTKGKGTTASMIDVMLRQAGLTVHLVGNIGNSALEALPSIQPEDVVIYELSSFQLWDIEKSPHIAVLLGIEADHLDVHMNMDEYVTAKANIMKFQTADDICFYHPTNAIVADIAHLAPRAKRYNYQADGTVYVTNGWFMKNDEQLFSTDILKVVGEHNIENACAAISVALEYSQDIAALEQGLGSFTGLPHRLKFIREVNRVKFYDDSIATTPGSAIAAIKSFSEPKVLILGGSDKGASYQEVIEECERTNTEVIAVGQTGEQIAELCDELGVAFTRESGDMTRIVHTAFHAAEPGDVVILSPAAASYDMFKNYADRGNQFVAAVSRL